MSDPRASSPVVAPAVGTELHAYNKGEVITNEQQLGFDAFDSSGGLQVYDVAGNLLNTLSADHWGGDCVTDVIASNGERLILTQASTDTPQKGFTAASTELWLTAWDAVTGKKVWSDQVTPKQATGPDCATFSFTLDGKWGAFQWDYISSSAAQDKQIDDVVNLGTGQSYSQPDLVGTLGNYIVTSTDPAFTGSQASYTLTEPPAWPVLGSTIVTSSGNGGISLLNPGFDSNGNSKADGGPDDIPTYLAQTGMISGGCVCSQQVINSEVVPGGKELVTLYSDASGNNTYFRGYALPSFKLLWSRPSAEVGTNELAAVTSSAMITDSDSGDAQGTNLVALDPSTGKTLWQVNAPDGEHVVTCDATASQVLTTVNGQLTTLSAKTGKQLSYQDASTTWSINGDCPLPLFGGLTGVGFDASNRLVQLLKP